MSVKQSDLSSKQYGYDFVVATTQASINATMKEFLYESNMPVVTMYYNMGSDGITPVPVDYNTLMSQTNNTDPLKVASWNMNPPPLPMNQDIENINNSNFWYGFQAQIGIPSGVLPQNLPDIIKLQPQSQSVIFTLLCAEFTIVEANFGRHGIESFLNQSQPVDKLWTFTATVPLKQILNNANLPAAVQNQLNNLGPDAFSVQQLMFDLDNAALQSLPTIGGVPSGSSLMTALSQVFCGAYFKAMQTQKQPVLNFTLLPNAPAQNPSTLTLTKMELEVSQYQTPAGENAPTNADDLNTLNYLCAANNNNLPEPTPFSWNWIEQNEEGSFDGVVAINRDALVDYLKGLLVSMATNQCFMPTVNVTYHSGPWYEAGLGGYTSYAFGLTPGQTPTLAPSNGEQVISYSYQSPTAHDQAGLDGDMGKAWFSSSYNLNVTFNENTIIIQQHLKVYLSAEGTFGIGNSYYPIDKTITDTYTLAVDENGGLEATLKSSSQDNSQTPSLNWFTNFMSSDMNSLANQIQGWLNNFVGTNFTDIPISVIQNFIFPGGNTFSYKDVTFSDNQDLVSRVVYTDPGSAN